MQERIPFHERSALSPREAGLYANVARSTIYRWLDDGLIPSTKIGRNRRIPRQALDELLTGQVFADA